LIGGRNLPFLPDAERLPVAREERSFDGTMIRKALDRMKRPIAIVSGLSPRVAPMVRRVLALWNIPLYIEAPSQLRDSDELAALQLRSGDVGLKHLVETHGVDGEIRIGAVPTVRLWRDIEEKEHLQVVSFS